MRKLKFLGLFIAAGLLMQSAYAACPTGQQACIGMNQTNVFNESNMYVYTCQSNGTWQKTGGSCHCSGLANAVVENNGNIYCAGPYSSGSQAKANANMSYASNGFSTSAQ